MVRDPASINYFLKMLQGIGIVLLGTSLMMPWHTWRLASGRLLDSYFLYIYFKDSQQVVFRNWNTPLDLYIFVAFLFIIVALILNVLLFLLSGKLRRINEIHLSVLINTLIITSVAIWYASIVSLSSWSSTVLNQIIAYPSYGIYFAILGGLTTFLATCYPRERKEKIQTSWQEKMLYIVQGLGVVLLVVCIALPWDIRIVGGLTIEDYFTYVYVRETRQLSIRMWNIPFETIHILTAYYLILIATLMSVIGLYILTASMINQKYRQLRNLCTFGSFILAYITFMSISIWINGLRTLTFSSYSLSLGCYFAGMGAITLISSSIFIVSLPRPQTPAAVTITAVEKFEKQQFDINAVRKQFLLEVLSHIETNISNIAQIIELFGKSVSKKIEALTKELELVENQSRQQLTHIRKLMHNEKYKDAHKALISLKKFSEEPLLTALFELVSCIEYTMHNAENFSENVDLDSSEKQSIASEIKLAKGELVKGKDCIKTQRYDDAINFLYSARNFAEQTPTKILLDMSSKVKELISRASAVLEKIPDNIAYKDTLHWAQSELLKAEDYIREDTYLDAYLSIFSAKKSIETALFTSFSELVSEVERSVSNAEAIRKKFAVPSEAALKHQIEKAEAQLLRGKTLIETGKYDEAVECVVSAKKLAEISPKGFLLNLSSGMEELLSKIEHSFERIQNLNMFFIKVDLSEAKEALLKGKSLIDSGDYDDAFAFLSLAKKSAETELASIFSALTTETQTKLSDVESLIGPIAVSESPSTIYFQKANEELLNAQAFITTDEYEKALDSFHLSIKHAETAATSFLSNLSARVEEILSNAEHVSRLLRPFNVLPPEEDLEKVREELSEGRAYCKERNYSKAFLALSSAKEFAETAISTIFSEIIADVEQTMSNAESILTQIPSFDISPYKLHLENAKEDFLKGKMCVTEYKYTEALELFLLAKKSAETVSATFLSDLSSSVEELLPTAENIAKQSQNFNIRFPTEILNQVKTELHEGKAKIKEGKFNEALSSLFKAKEVAENSIHTVFSEIIPNVEKTLSDIEELEKQFETSAEYTLHPQLTNAKEDLFKGKTSFKEQKYDDAISCLISAKTSAETIPTTFIFEFFSNIKKMISRAEEFEKIQDFIEFPFNDSLKNTKDELHDGKSLVEDRQYIEAFMLLSSLNESLNTILSTALSEFSSSVENIISEIERLFTENKVRSIYSPIIRLERAKEKMHRGISCLNENNYVDAFIYLSSAKRSAENLISLPTQLFAYIRYEILTIHTIDNALIFFFLVSLMICAFITIFNENLANTILTYTFWFLVAGIIWKFVSLIKEEKGE